MNRQPTIPVSCPECGAMFDLIQALEDKDGRLWVNYMAENLPPVAFRALVRYLKLFKPQKQILRYSRMYKLTKELTPMMKAAEVKRGQLTYVAPAALWAKCMGDLVDNPPDSLKLPLTGNGYLISMVANQADQGAAKAEKQQAKKIKERTSHRSPKSVAAFVAPDEDNATTNEAAKGFLQDLLKATKGGHNHE